MASVPVFKIGTQIVCISQGCYEDIYVWALGSKVSILFIAHYIFFCFFWQKENYSGSWWHRDRVEEGSRDHTSSVSDRTEKNMDGWVRQTWCIFLFYFWSALRLWWNTPIILNLVYVRGPRVIMSTELNNGHDYVILLRWGIFIGVEKGVIISWQQ